MKTKTVRSLTSRLVLASLLIIGTTRPMIAQNYSPVSDAQFHVGQQERNAIGDREYYEKITKVKEKATQEGTVYEEPTIISWDERGFAYMGVCEAIWYPEVLAENKKFVEDWPALRNALIEQNIEIPVLAQGSSPWHNEEELNADLVNLKKSDAEISDADQITRKNQLSELLGFLSQENVMKVEYASLSDRLERAVNPNSESSMLKNLPPGKAEIIKANFDLVAKIKDDSGNPLGLYALVDYCNFKGEGTAPAEHYNTQPWGLGEVLFRMNELRSDAGTLNDYINKLNLKQYDPKLIDAGNLSDIELFVIAAAKVLDNRIENNKIERTRIMGTPAYAEFIAHYGDENTVLTDAEKSLRDQAFRKEFGLPYHDNSQYRLTMFYPHLVNYLIWPGAMKKSTRVTE